LLFFVALVFPLDGALDLTFEVCWESCRDQRHFDVLMGVRFELSRHWLKFEVVSAHETRFLEFKLQFLVLVQIVQNYKPVANFSRLKVAKVDGFVGECSHLAFFSDVSSAFWKVLIKLYFLRSLLFSIGLVAATSKH